jgi:hypothetical protein
MMRRRTICGWICLAALLLSEGMAATWTCADTTRSAFDTQYNNASDGDTIIIPAGGSAGSPTAWTTAYVIEKGITIKGTLSGTNWATFLKRSSGQIFEIHMPSDKMVRICYIDFDHDGTFSQADNSAIYFSPGGHTKQFRIDHNRFGPKGSKTIAFFSWNYGVIDHNYCYNSDSDIFDGGYDSNDVNNDGEQEWLKSLNVGDTNRPVIEDNVFLSDNGVTADPNEKLYGQAGPRGIFRYNLVDTTAMTARPTAAIDAHGKFGPAATGMNYSTISYEIYKNTFAIHHGNRLMNLRGGSHLVYSNTVTTVTGSTSIELKDEGFSTYGTPVSDPSYHALGQWTTNCFASANTVNGSTLNFSVESSPDSSPYVVLGQHYFNRMPTTGDSSTVQSGGVVRQLVYPHPLVTAQDGGGTSGGGSGSVKAKRQSGRRR